MNYQFFITCFGVGIAAASGIGPIFVLTFNKGALKGFSRGFATALGASLIDGFFFFLALMGVLTTLEDAWQFMTVLDFLGAIVLWFLGFRMLKSAGDISVAISARETFFQSFKRALFLTLINPMTIIFFMLVATKIVPEDAKTMTAFSAFLASMFVVAGSLSILGSVAGIATFVGHKIEKKYLKLISFVTGIIFLMIGCYLFFLFLSSFYS